MTSIRFLRHRLAARRVATPAGSPPARAWGDRGEGVISAAIAVLVMAFLGVGMWVGLQSIWDTAEENTADQVEEIGR
jgi:hypothetical protein